MRIAVFDYYIEPTNPIGSCHRRLLDHIQGEHDITVFAVRFDSPSNNIRWVRVPAPRRPLALLFVTYHLLAPLCYYLYRLRQTSRFDLVQEVESNLTFGDIAYTHFCHRAFLRSAGAPRPQAGLRSLLRWLDHRLHALAEPRIYRDVTRVVVPSHGLARELVSEYPNVAGRVTVIPNPIDVEHFRPPSPKERRAERRSMGWSDEDVVFAFIALGHFERKGLPLLLEAMKEVGDPRAQLLVVGGERDLTKSYEKKATAMGIGDRTRFVGMQSDVRPFLHTSDVFVLPSSYEAFPLVALEAAAAGLPLLVTPLHGVEEYVRPGKNGFVTARDSADVARGVRTLMTMSPQERASLGQTARQDASRYGIDEFVGAWRTLYEDMTPARAMT